MKKLIDINVVEHELFDILPSGPVTFSSFKPTPRQFIDLKAFVMDYDELIDFHKRHGGAEDLDIQPGHSYISEGDYAHVMKEAEKHRCAS